MRCTQIEPLEDIKCSPSEGPINECLKLKNERYCHKSLECNIINDMITVHKEVALLHLSYTVPDLKGAYPKITAIQYIEDYKGPVLSKFITIYLIFVLTCYSNTVRKVLQFLISCYWEVPENKGMHK
jgi:hypothetical protein